MCYILLIPDIKLDLLLDIVNFIHFEFSKKVIHSVMIISREVWSKHYSRDRRMKLFNTLVRYCHFYFTNEEIGIEKDCTYLDYINRK